MQQPQFLFYQSRSTEAPIEIAEALFEVDEVENKEVNIRRFGSKDQFPKSLDDFYDYVVDEAAIKFDK